MVETRSSRLKREAQERERHRWKVWRMGKVGRMFLISLFSIFLTVTSGYSELTSCEVVRTSVGESNQGMVRSRRDSPWVIIEDEEYMDYGLRPADGDNDHDSDDDDDDDQQDQDGQQREDDGSKGNGAKVGVRDCPSLGVILLTGSRLTFAALWALSILIVFLLERHTTGYGYLPAAFICSLIGWMFILLEIMFYVSKLVSGHGQVTAAMEVTLLCYAVIGATASLTVDEREKLEQHELEDKKSDKEEEFEEA